MNAYNNTDNTPTKYQIIALLLLLFAFNLSHGYSFRIFLIINMLIIFGAAILLNTIEI